MVTQLKNNGNVELELGGHTDNTGDPDANMSLSESRARAVAVYLTTNGIGPERLTAKGYGQDDPRDTNGTAEGRQKNRRTQFIITAQ